MTPAILLLAIVAFTLLGCLAGIVTGLIPGLHVNNIAQMVLVSEAALISMASYLFGWAGPGNVELLIIISAMIIGTVITHTFMDFIPSAFLGAPDADTALTVLPGHRMMLAGRGYEAVKCSVTGSFGAIIVALALIVPLRLIVGEPVEAYSKLEGFIHFVLVGVSIFLILGERARPGEALGNFNGYEINGFVLSGSAKLKSAAHEGVKITSVSRLADSDGEEVAVRGKVMAVAIEGDSRYLKIGKDGAGGKWARIKIHKKAGYVPGIGEEVVVMGTVTPFVTWKDHLIKRAKALGVFLLAGALGVILLSTEGLVGQNITFIDIPVSDTGIVLLFPLFTGLFGLSTLVLSLKDRPVIPEQKTGGVRVGVGLREQAKSVVSGTVASVSSLFPAVSSAISTMIAVNLHGGRDDSGKKNDESGKFIISVSAVNTSVGVFNLLALFVIMKSRSGAMKSVERVLGDNVRPWENMASVPLELSSLLVAAVVAGIVAMFLTLYFGKLFARHCSKIDYQRLVWGVVVFLLAMTLIFSGLLGLLILAVSTCIGLIPPMLGLKRVHLMGCLVLPVIVFFL